MSELSKCLQGKQFNCIDDELVSIITKARRLTKQYNQTKFEDTIQKDSILSELFAKIGNNVKIDVPFYCDYGQHISIGNNVIININCTFVDCNKITIGNNVLIASNVQIYTATHPVNISDRLLDNWSYNNPHAFFNTYALPVTIEDNVWIGGGVIILPGVTIGKNSVIGAGSVVNKSIPPNSLAVGNPCKVIRKINNKNWLCHNKQLINSHFYRGVSELPYKLLFAVIYTHLEFRYEVSHTITSHHVHHFHQTRIPDGTLLDYMVQYRKPLFPQFFLYPKKFLPENNPHHKEFHLRPYIQNNANQ